MKKLFILTFAILGVALLQAQIKSEEKPKIATIKITLQTDNVSILSQTDNTINEKIEDIKLTLIRDKNPADDDIDHLDFILDRKTLPSNIQLLAPTSINLKADDWKGKKAEVILHLKNCYTDEKSISLAGDNYGTGYLLLVGDDKNYVQINLVKDKPKVSKGIPDSVYNRTDLAFGGSFDFNNGLSATQFYYSLKMNWPDVFKKYNKTNKGIKSFGASFGIYQTQLFGQSDSATIGLTNTLPNNIRTSYFSIQGDSVKIVRAQLNGYSRNQSISTLGGFFNPTFLLFGKKDVSISALVNLEYARRTITTTRAYNFIPLDTITIYKTMFANYNAVNTSNRIVNNYNEFYFGVGFAIRIIKNGIDFNLDACLGKGDYSAIGWQSYYATNLNVKFIKYNFELGANYKGLVQSYNTLSPYYFSFHLAKLFSFDKMISFLSK